MARKRRQDRKSNEQELEEFLGALALEGRSPHSVGAYRRDLAALLAALPGPLDAVRPADLRDVFRHQQQAGRSPSSINRAIGATRSFYRFLYEEGRLEMNPAQALRLIRVGPPLAPKHLTVAEVQRLLSLPDIAMGTLVEALTAGMQAAETRRDRLHQELAASEGSELPAALNVLPATVRQIVSDLPRMLAAGQVEPVKSALSRLVGKIEVHGEERPRRTRPGAVLVLRGDLDAALQLASEKAKIGGSPGGIRTRDPMAENHVS